MTPEVHWLGWRQPYDQVSAVGVWAAPIGGGVIAYATTLGATAMCPEGAVMDFECRPGHQHVGPWTSNEVREAQQAETLARLVAYLCEYCGT